jgi:hypothetical protein
MDATSKTSLCPLGHHDTLYLGHFYESESRDAAAYHCNQCRRRFIKEGNTLRWGTGVPTKKEVNPNQT